MSKGFMDPVERAKRKIEELSGEPADPGAIPPVEPPVEPGAVTDPPPVDPATPPAATPPADEDENSQSYKQRWAALQGILKGEQQKAAGLAQEVAELKEQLQQVLRQQQTTPPPAASGTTLRDGATQQELRVHLNALLEEYDEKFVNVLGGFVREEFQGLIQAELEPLRAQFKAVEQDTEAAKQAATEAELDRIAPMWRTVTKDPSFTSWLAGTQEPMSGKTYGQLFDEANKSYDLPRLAIFVNTFAQSTGLAPPPPGATPPPADPREKLVAPGRGAAGQATPTNNGPVMYTESQMKKFYRDLQEGRYRGKEAEAERIQQDLFRANAEGRILPG